MLRSSVRSLARAGVGGCTYPPTRPGSVSTTRWPHAPRSAGTSSRRVASPCSGALTPLRYPQYPPYPYGTRSSITAPIVHPLDARRRPAATQRNTRAAVAPMRASPGADVESRRGCGRTWTAPSRTLSRGCRAESRSCLPSPGADVGKSQRRCGQVPAQMWAKSQRRWAAAKTGQGGFFSVSCFCSGLPCDCNLRGKARRR